MTQDKKLSPIDDLIFETLRLSKIDADSEERWAVVHALHRRDPVTVFGHARKLCSGKTLVERELGTDLLQIIGNPDEPPHHPMKAESIPVLLKLLEDPEPRVIASAIYVLGHLGALEERLEHHQHLVDHESVWIRLAIACSLGSDGSAPNVVEALIKLTNDEDKETRNWATFSLGTQCEADSPEIREALFARLDENDHEIRGEAMVGLARRKDVRVLPNIKKEIESGYFSSLPFEAAEELADPILLPLLQDAAKWWDQDTYTLKAAIEACRGESPLLR